jgi:hypothetical protein
MRRVCLWLSALLFLAALAALLTMLGSDLWRGFRPSERHQRAGGGALVFAGLSFVCLLWGQKSRGAGLIRGLLLGLAFVLWGAEAFLPAGPRTTAIDAAVIAIFVLDLGLIIRDGWRTPDRPAGGA